MPQRWENPNRVSRREQMDRRLERAGLLNYQTEGLSQEEIARRYAAAGISINGRSQWYKQNYGVDAPEVLTDRRQMFRYRQQIFDGTAPRIFPQIPIQYQPNQQRDLPAYNPNQAAIVGTNLNPRLQSVKLPDTNTDSYLASTVFATSDDVKKSSANWMDVSSVERNRILSDPNFYNGEILKYPYIQQQAILADPNFQWDRLPSWQQSYFTAISNPAIAGSFQGYLMSMGNPGGALFGAVLGGAAGYYGYDPAKEYWQQGDENNKMDFGDTVRGAIGLLNWAAEQAEKGLGVLLQSGAILTGNDPNFDPKKRNLDIRFNPDFNPIPGTKDYNPNLLTGSTWDAGAATYEVMAPSLYEMGVMDNIFQGRKPSADDLLNLVPLVQMWNLVTRPEDFKGTEAYLGVSDPVKLEQTFYERIQEAKRRIDNGENYRQVTLEMQNGIMAQVGDMVAQSVADPINVLPKANTLAGEGIARAGDNKVWAEAFAQSRDGRTPGFFDAAARYRNIINTPGEALKVDPTYKVSELSAISKFIAGLNSEGEVRRGFFSNKGLLDTTPNKRNPLGFIQYLSDNTPEARARIGQDLLLSNIGRIMSAYFGGVDVEGFSNWWKSFSNGDMQQAADLSRAMAQAPEFYTVLPAAKDFDIDNLLSNWQATDGVRKKITQVADILGENPASMIENMVKRGTMAQDFARLRDKLLNMPGPEAKALLNEIQNGQFTAQTLKDMVGVFADGSIPYHPGQWMAQTIQAIKEHYDNWAVKHFNLDAESKKTLFRMSAVLKSAQSILLLGANPGYFISNVLPTMVTRAMSGVWGYMTPSAIDDFMKRMGFDGFKPNRYDEVVGITDIRADDPIRKAVQGKGFLTNASRVIGKIGQAMPFNVLSRLLEGHEGKQAYVIGIRKFWGEQWRRGKAFREIPLDLKAELERASGKRATDILYSAIEAGMSKQEIANIITTASRNIQSRSLINEAAQRLNLPASRAAMLEQAGVLDALDAELRGARSETQVRNAFERAKQIAKRALDEQAARDAIANIEHVSERLNTEGVKAITDIILDTEDAGIENWLQHYQRMGEVAEAVESMDNPVSRSSLWSLRYAESEADFRRYNAHKASVYLGVLKALGQDESPHAKAILANMADTDAALGNAYKQMRKLRDDHFNKWNNDWDNPSRQVERTAVERKIEKIWKDATQREIRNSKKFGELLGQQYEISFSKEAGEAARQAWEQISAFRKEMTIRRDAFRMSIESMPLAQRRIESRKFWGETYKYMIVEMQRIKTEAINRLDAIANGKGGGDPTPAGTEPGPTPPDTSPAAAPAGPSAEEMNALRQAAEARAAAEEAKINDLWTLAGEYGYNKTILQHTFGLLGSLSKPEYGGDPTFKGTIKDAAARFTLEEVDAILEKRRQVKDAEDVARIASRNMELQRKREEAAKKAIKRKPTNILQAIIGYGGLDWKHVQDITGEKNPPISQKKIFSKNGRNRWGLDEMARLLADDGYPINLDDPNDNGGLAQTTDLIQRAFRGENIYSLNDAQKVMDQAEADIVKAEIEHYAELQAEDAFDEGQWMTDVTLAILDEDAGRMNDIFSTLPDEYLDMPASPTETYREYIEGRRQDLADRQEAQAIAEAKTKSEIAIENQQRVADISTAREELVQKYAEAFPNVSAEQIGSWMIINDAVVNTMAKMSGVTPDEIYKRYYEDIIRGVGDTDSYDMYQRRTPKELLTETPEYALDRREYLSRREIMKYIEENKEALGVDPASVSDILDEIRKQYLENTYVTSYGRLPKLTQTLEGQALLKEFRLVLTERRWYEMHKSMYDFKDYREFLRLRGKELFQKKSKGGPTNTPEFKQWFGKSKVVDRDGQPLVVYRAESRGDTIDIYDPKKTETGAFFFTPDKEAALGYTDKIEKVNAFYLKAENILDLTKDSKQAMEFVNEWGKKYKTWIDRTFGEAEEVTPWQALQNEDMWNSFPKRWSDLQKAIKKAGYDGAILPDSDGGLWKRFKSYIVFAPEQIKSVNNQGTFDPNNPNIFRQQADAEIKGGVSFVDGKAIIAAWDGADITTIIHENGHVFRKMMVDVAKKTANGHLLRDVHELDNWVYTEAQRINKKIAAGENLTEYELAVSDGNLIEDMVGNQWQRGHEEIFARAWERYIADGKVPSSRLMSVFQRFTKWITDIYKSITGSAIDIELSPEIRRMFDRLVGVENTRVEIEKIITDLGWDPNKVYMNQNGYILPRETLQEIKFDKRAISAEVDEIMRVAPEKVKKWKEVWQQGDEVSSLQDKVKAAKERAATKAERLVEEGDLVNRVRNLSQWTNQELRKPYSLGDLVEYDGKTYEVGWVTPGGLLRLQDPITHERVVQVAPSSVTPTTKTEAAPQINQVESQTEMFDAGQDTPLFSQTPQRADMETFTPTEQTRQETMFDMRPQFGQEEPSLTPNPAFIVDNETGDVGLVVGSDEDGQPRARFSGPLTITPRDWKAASSLDFDRAMRNAGAERKARLNGWKKAAENIPDLTPEIADRYAENLADINNQPIDKVPEVAGRERLLMEAIVQRVKDKNWFAKSRDFESFVRTLGFNIEDEAELNLAYDIMEGAYNLQAREVRAQLDANNASLLDRLVAMDEMERNLTEARRTLGKMKLQQFSTPLTLSEAAGWAADVRPGDVVGEPTAGTANLVDLFSQREGVKVVVNELDPGRRQVLELIGYEPTGLNLMATEWVISNGKKAGPWANVMISNPPWGAYSTGKYGKPVNTPVKMNDWSQRFTYLELIRLADDGRFVGVMPANWLYTMDRATRTITNKPSEFYKWLKKNYTVQAVIESPPGAYKNRATDISSLLVVIDKRMSLIENQPLEKFGADQPKTWAEYADFVQQVPKRSMEAVANGHQKIKPIVAGPDASGIVDPAAVKSTRPNVEDIGKPVETPNTGTVKPRGTDADGQGTDAGSTSARVDEPIAEPSDTAGAGEQPATPVLVDEQPDGISGTDEEFHYSDGFLAKLEQGRAAVKNSGSFAEYVGRAPLSPDDVIHPHPNTVVETKGLAGVPYPELEEEYRPSPSVMRAMKNRALSYDGNLDPTWAAIQQNDKHGMGMLIADDVGMGKSRTAAAFVLDRIEKGKKRILVVTKDGQNVLNLMNSEFPQVYKGVADENGAFINPPGTEYPAKRIFLSGENFPEVKKGEAAIPTFEEPTVYFVTSSEFAHFEPKIELLDIDVLVVDEAHLFKNVGSTARGQAWVKLHQQIMARKANILYLTATPGVDLSDLRYLFGLRVWHMDGFEDWIKIITGQESVEQVKKNQQARDNIDAWVEKVKTARNSIDVQPDDITAYGDTYDGLRVGKVGMYKSTERYNAGRYMFEIEGKNITTAITNEIEAVIVADAVNKKLNELPMEYSVSDIRDIVNDAEVLFTETFNPPGREEIRSVNMKDASDILQNAEKGKWGKKGLGAFDATLPPAHTEQIMRELKVSGSYMSRDISRAGVDFGVKEYTPPAADKAAFNRRVMLYRRIYEAWAKYGAMNEGAKKAAAMFGINGDIQADAKRALFNMRLPGIITEAQEALARGEQVVISVVSVSEVDGETGSLPSAISKINTQKVEKTGKDSYSDPADIPEAFLEIEEIKEELRDLGTMPSPIDVIRDAFGENVAFVTGATSTKDRIQAQRDFQKNKLDVIVISGAGKTGINLHDITGKRRMHLIVGDYEWSATNFKQELGRVDRTGQRSSPIVTVMHTGSAGEKKFVATISNRMKGLGATSKGGSESTGTGAMTETFELGNTMDKIALAAAWQDFPVEWKAAFLDKYFRDPTVPNIPRTVLETNSEALSKFLLGLQSIDIDTANQIMEAYMAKRVELSQLDTSADDAASRKTAASTGEILRQVELGENLRLTEVKASDGSKYGILDGVLTPHMNNVKGIVTAGADYADRFIQGGNAWMRWVQFYDPTKNEYVTGLQVKPTRVKDVAEHFGKAIGSGHKPETAMLDMRAGDRISIIGSNVAQWELYLGRGGAREGKIVVDGAKIKDRDALMNNGANFSAVGSFFFVPEENLMQFLKRFPIKAEGIDTSTLYQKARKPQGPLLPGADPRIPLGGYEEAAAWQPQSQPMGETWTNEIEPLLNSMQEVAIERTNDPDITGTYANMTPEGKRLLKQYLSGVQSDMASTKMAATRWGKDRRDYALLNYNERTNFDRWLDIAFPYQFFYTRSMMTWVARALDNPAIVANYARLRKQQDRYENNLPERLRGKMRIEAPYLPDWMGDGLYIDPLSVLFTPHNFLRPFEQMARDTNQQEIEAERILQEWSMDETVPQEKIIQADKTRSGDVWERALAEAKMRREAQINNPMDFVSATFGPAWYLSTPAKFLSGEAETITELPLTRTARAIDTVTDNTWAEPVGNLLGLLAKPEQKFREEFNLPEFGEYGDYYIDRQLANMVAEGKITSEQATITMIERSGPLFDEARDRVKLELSMRVPLMGATYAALNEGAGAGLQALPASLFGAGILPEGELEYRGLKQEWNDAWKLKDAGDKDAINRFFEDHPEYEAYLAKGKEPEDRLKTFLIGQIWDGYMSLGPTDRRLAEAELGEEFEAAFLDSETRSYDVLDIDTLTQWAQMLHKQVPNVPETLPAIQEAEPIDFLSPEITAISDQYFEQRKRMFPNYYEVQAQYDDLPKSERRAYLVTHPELKAYWDWNRSWKERYPELVPVFTGEVFRRVDTSTWNPMLLGSVENYVYSGIPLGNGSIMLLEQIWISEGRPYDTMEEWIKNAVIPSFIYGE